ncbi:hypothetical protein [Naasia sp. SYSU D00057]|uniref:hypothetical protein n=1 Tax=Naasia sp. SYSU D00057 TaxID=2817380 RepID=UPI001B306401|nr:hypothetical protein [Naasia sp. SYSU D00057]
MARGHQKQNVVGQNVIGQSVGTCDHGMLCVDDRPGHAMTLLRLRLSASTPRGWADAVVAEAGEGGWVRLQLWEDGEERWVWHHASLADSLHAGDPVALHEAYSVLAVGADRYNVAQL